MFPENRLKMSSAKKTKLSMKNDDLELGSV